MAIKKIIYVTTNQFKRDENSIFAKHAQLADGTPVRQWVEFDFRDDRIPERLEVNIEAMVALEVREAYRQVRLPCIVEHAGLVFEDYKERWYPGGLTKPMWDTLGQRFVEETKSQNRRATATAVVGYCDGMKIKTFKGETTGTLTGCPHATRSFYWDTVFVPDDPSGRSNKKTYAEIVDDAGLGLKYKVLELSQSSRAMRSFVEFLSKEPSSPLWR